MLDSSVQKPLITPALTKKKPSKPARAKFDTSSIPTIEKVLPNQDQLAQDAEWGRHRPTPGSDKLEE